MLAAQVRRFLSRVSLALPVLVLPPVVNYTVDPANIFAHPGVKEKQIAQYLLAGLNVTNWQFYDDRAIQANVINGLREAPETIVFGSSRSMLIGSRTHPAWKVRNNSVSGAALEDYLGMYNAYRRRGILPKRIVLGVDPWVLNENDNLNRWMRIEPDVREMLGVLGVPPWEAKSTFQGPLSSLRRKDVWNYLNLLDLDYFQQSALFVLKRGEPRPKFLATKQDYNDDYTKLADGTMTDSRKIRDRDLAARTREAEAYPETYPWLYLLTDYGHVSERNERVLGMLIDYMRAHGSEVVIFLPPYHPVVQSFIDAHQDRYAVVADAERHVRALAASRNLRIVGSYDPRTAQTTATDFLDGHHLNAAAITRLFGTL